MKIMFLFFQLLLVLTTSLAQQNPIHQQHYFPKDSLKFAHETGFDFQNESVYALDRFGNTTCIVRAATTSGVFYFVFKKKLRAGVDQPEATLEYYGNPMGDAKPANSDDSYPLTDHNLYAFVLVEDHGGLLLKARFQDFGNAVYWPQFDYTNCFIADADADGAPEFYLSYMGDSDGLDAKPYKQIVYYYTASDKAPVTWNKSKATAYYPSGNEDDEYHVDYDAAWKAMPEKIRQRSEAVIRQHRAGWTE